MKFVTCLALVAVILFSVVAALAREPSGAYCGNYMGHMVTGKAVMSKKDHTFDLAVKALGNAFSCEGIKYELQGKGDHVLVPDALNPDSCLGSMLHSNGLSLAVTYDLGSNKVVLDLGITKLQLKSC